MQLAAGRRVPFDRLLIATGTRARPWPDPQQAALDGVFTLRTRDDAARLRARLACGPTRVLIIGAGFTGFEVASVCRELGLAVAVAERSAAPLAGVRVQLLIEERDASLVPRASGAPGGGWVTK